MKGQFRGTCALAKFLMRRERFNSGMWLAILVLFCVPLAPGMGAMFDAQARAALAETLKNPAMVSMMGPVYGADNYTPGAMYTSTMLLWTLIAVAVMNIFLVVRHTRADEERGRAEVLRSLPAGRLSGLGATMITAVAVNLLLAALFALGLGAMGVEGMGFGASLLYGVILGATGLFFAAVAAVFSQLCASSRGAFAWSFLSLGAFYMLRAAGDIGNEALSLISPLGLALRTQAYVENHWWPILALLLGAAVIAALAFLLNAKRDLDQGYIPARPGRREASFALRSPMGLAFRLLRNTLIAWFVIMLALGASYGSILGDIDTFVAQSEFYAMVMQINDAYGNMEMFASMVNSIMALICAVPLILMAAKPRSEEKEGRAEHSLARAVSRTRYMCGYLALAFAASVLFQLATAFGLYAAGAQVLTEPIALGYLLKANLVYLPALWVMMGITILLVGIAPRASGAVWGFFGFSFFVSFVGRIMDLPAFLQALSPFHYIPQLPVDEIRALPLAALTAIALALTAAGVIFYRKRDVVPS